VFDAPVCAACAFASACELLAVPVVDAGASLAPFCAGLSLPVVDAGAFVVAAPASLPVVDAGGTLFAEVCGVLSLPVVDAGASLPCVALCALPFPLPVVDAGASFADAAFCALPFPLPVVDAGASFADAAFCVSPLPVVDAGASLPAVVCAALSLPVVDAGALPAGSFAARAFATAAIIAVIATSHTAISRLIRRRPIPRIASLAARSFTWPHAGTKVPVSPSGFELVDLPIRLPQPRAMLRQSSMLRNVDRKHRFYVDTTCFSERNKHVFEVGRMCANLLQPA
jgi:hypothetical protein